MDAADRVGVPDSLFVYTGQRPSFGQVAGECARAILSQNSIVVASSALIAFSIQLPKLLEGNKLDKWNWSSFMNDHMLNLTASVFVQLVSEAAYGAFRLAGFDFGRIGTRQLKDRPHFFAPRYIMGCAATAYLKTLSSSDLKTHSYSLLGLTMAMLVASNLMPVAENKRENFSEKVDRFIALDQQFSERTQPEESDNQPRGEIQSTLPDYKKMAYAIINIQKCTLDEIRQLMDAIEERTSTPFQALFNTDLNAQLLKYKGNNTEPSLSERFILQYTQDLSRYLGATLERSFVGPAIFMDVALVAMKLLFGVKFLSVVPAKAG